MPLWLLPLHMKRSTKNVELILLTGKARHSCDAAKHAYSTKSLRSAILDEMLCSESLPCEAKPPGMQCSRVQSCCLNAASAF